MYNCFCFLSHLTILCISQRLVGIFERSKIYIWYLCLLWNYRAAIIYVNSWCSGMLMIVMASYSISLKCLPFPAQDGWGSFQWPCMCFDLNFNILPWCYVLFIILYITFSYNSLITLRRFGSKKRASPWRRCTQLSPITTWRQLMWKRPLRLRKNTLTPKCSNRPWLVS